MEESNIILEQLKNEIEKRRMSALQDQEFLLFKKTHLNVARQLDEKINGFFSEDLNSTVSHIKLPQPIKDEIAYFNFVSDKYDMNSFFKKFKLIIDKLKSFDSPFIIYANTVEWKNKNNDTTLTQSEQYHDFFKSWTFMLNKRILDFRLKIVDDLRYNFLVDVHSKIKKYNQYSKIYKNFYDAFGKVAKIENDLSKKNIESIVKFSKFMNNDPSILKIAELLGRLNGEDDLLEKNLTERIIVYPTYRKLPVNPEEISGVVTSNNLERVLPFEFNALFEKELEIIFYKKFIERELQSLYFQSNEQIMEHDIEEVEYETNIPLDQGKFIVCIDTSSSMEGSGEYIAKALALAVIKVALKTERDIVIYNFSTNVEEFTINGKNVNLNKLIEFMAKSFYGKTNAEPAFKKIIKKMWEEDFNRADLLMISDFMINSMPNSQREQISDLKQKYNRFHSLVVGGMPNLKTQEIFDNVMYYDPDDPNSTKQIVKSLNKTLNNLEKLSDEELKFRDEQLKEFNEIRDKRLKRKVVDKDKITKKDAKKFKEFEKKKQKENKKI